MSIIRGARDEYEVVEDNPAQRLAEKIAVEIGYATVSEGSMGTSWSVKKIRCSYPSEKEIRQKYFVAGEIVLYHLDPNEIIKGFGEPKNVYIAKVPKIAIHGGTDFERLNEYLLRSAILVDRKKYIGQV
jgi:hypothetical protein